MQQRVAGSAQALSGKAAEREIDIPHLQIRQARRVYGVPAPEISADQRRGFDLTTLTLDADAARKEAQRCLQCDRFCNICTTVCPNRANVSYRLEPGAWPVARAIQAQKGVRLEALETVRITQPYQIINLGDFCNACGNCATFCPTNGAPYRIKPKFFISERAFKAVANGFQLKGEVLTIKTNYIPETLWAAAGGLFYQSETVEATLDPKSLAVQAVRFLSPKIQQADLKQALILGLLFNSLKDFDLFNDRGTTHEFHSA
jgi:putative selenate reductase